MFDLAPELRAALSNRVAKGLYDRAMSERRMYSREPGFDGEWPPDEPGIHMLWVSCALRVLDGDDQFESDDDA